MPRAKLTIAELETMRQRLSAAAMDLYKSEGLEALTFRRIAEAVGLSHTLPYRYFDNKDALLARMRTDCVRKLAASLLAREDVTAPPLARVHDIATGYVDFVRRHPDEYLLMFSTHQPRPDQYPELLAARQELFEHGVEVCRLCIEAGVLQGEARRLAHLLWINLHGLMTLHVANQLVHGYSLDELVEPMLERVLGVQSTVAGAKPRANARQRSQKRRA